MTTIITVQISRGKTPVRAEESKESEAVIVQDASTKANNDNLVSMEMLNKYYESK